MSVSQISVFMENRPGHMVRVLDLFKDAGVNVRGYCASDTGDYGIVRFVVDEPERALLALEGSGAAVKRTEVLCVKLGDEPGELARVFSVISACDINVNYSYSLISTYIALCVDDIVRAEALLRDQPVEFVDQQKLRETL